MSRRLYFSTTAADVTITPSASWTLGSIPAATTKATGPTKQNTALADITSSFFLSGDAGGLRWMSFLTPPLRNDWSFSTADSVSVVVRCLEGRAEQDANLAFVLRVMVGSTSTQRGLLVAQVAPSTEFETDAATAIFSGVPFTASGSALAGDRICMEMGIWGEQPFVTDVVTQRFGDPSATADFALTAGLTTDLVPWFEISADPVFLGDPNPATAAPKITLGLGPSGQRLATAQAVPAVILTFALTTTQIHLDVSNPSVQLQLAPSAFAKLGVVSTPSIRLSVQAIPNPIAQVSPRITLSLAATARATFFTTVSPGIRLSFVVGLAATASPRITLALGPNALQAILATAAPGVRLALEVHAIGGYVLAGSTVVAMKYNA